MSIFKKIFKGVTKLVPFGGIVSDIISPDKSITEKKEGLELLTPIAQFNRTMARPRIAIGIVFTYLGGTIIQWIQQLCGIHKAYLITISPELTEFAKIVVGVIVGTRGIEKIVSGILKRKKK